MKERLLKLLKAKQEQRDKLNAQLIESDDKEERAAIGETLKALGDEIKEVEELIANVDAPAQGGNGGEEGGERSGSTEGGENRSFNPLSTMQLRNGAANKPSKPQDKYDTEEYRTAFMEFVCRNKPIPAEFRADAVTTTTDASAVIPTTIMNEIVTELKSYGNLYREVRKLNVQGGVNIPILSLKPTATWIGETTDSDEQKLQANTSISFSYFGLECKIAQTLLASVTTLSIFQETFVPLAVESMTKALETAIMSGTGTNQPTGVTVDSRVPAGNKITISSTEIKSWSDWKKKVFGKMKKSYRNGKFYMAQSTFDGYIDGMTDSNGQPIGRVNYGIDGAETYRFGGKDVETVEDDIIKGYDDAATNDVIAVFLNPKDYAINSNLTMQTVKWTDHDTNEIKNKVILICDGKLVDANGVIIIKKGA